MRRLLLPFLIAFWGISFSVFAQTIPVLTAANTNPVLGETFKIWVARGVQLNNLTGGPNQVWNTGALSNAWHHTFIYQDPDSMPVYGNHYPNATLFRRQELAYWEFIQTTPNQLLNRGIVNTRGIVAHITTYSDPAIVLNYPFTYNDSLADTFRGTFGMGSPWPVFGRIISKAHGYGTIQTPAGTFNVLCVKTLEWETDSLGIQTAGDSIATFSFYAPGIHYPVCKSVYRSEFGVSYWVEYLDASSISGVSNEKYNQLSFQLFPNPATSEVTIQYQTPKPVKITLQDLVGKEVAQVYAGKGSAELQRVKIDVAKYPKGIYLLKLETEDKIFTKKLILQ